MSQKGSLFSLLVYSVLLSSCAPDSPLPEPVSYLGPRYINPVPHDPRGKVLIEPDFLPLVRDFELNHGNGQEIQTPIYFTNDLPRSVLGVCILWKKGNKQIGEIKVNRDTFGRDPIESEMIIFHELGHCELNRPHTEDLTILPDGRIVPFSLMYPVLFLSSDYSRFHEHYIIELFERGGLLEKVKSQKLENVEGIETIERNGFVGYIQP